MRQSLPPGHFLAYLREGLLDRCPLPQGPRVACGIDLFQGLLRYECVNLGRGDGGMSEELLDDADISAAFDQMSSKAVPQAVRAHRRHDPRPLGRIADDAPSALPR